MKELGCPHLWQVEAAHDGRLAAPALARHHEHVSHCNTCSHERRSLAELGQQLREQPSSIDELSLRRLRQVILERASEEMIDAHASPSGSRWRANANWLRDRRWQVGAVAAGLLLCSAAWLLHSRSGTAPAGDATWVAVSGREHGSHWTRQRFGDVERITLGQGYFRVTVRRKADDPRVVVDVPDGEIEDVGTVFEVDVGASLTNRIVVHEGTVVFRPHGAQALYLSAGQHWARTSTRPTQDEPLANEKVVTQPGEALQLPAAHHGPDAHHPHHAKPAHPHVDRDLADAAQPLAASASPENGEDAAYLHVVALLREGRDYEARLAALHYLEQYPHGFRRAEVQSISRPALAP